MNNRILLALVLVLLAALPLLPATPAFWITQLNYIGLASLVVLGLIVLTGVGGLTSFGQAAFVGIGAYASAWATTAIGASPWLGLLLGLVVTFAVSYLLGAITLRLSGHYLPLGTIAWCLSLYYLFGNLGFLGQYDGIAGIAPIEIFGFSLGQGRRIYYLIWICLLLAMWGTRNLLDSRPGRAIRALRSSGGMAESFGVNMATYKVIIFVYAALLASLSGWLYAHMQRAVSPSPFGLNYGIEYLFMAVVGGTGSVWGAVLGSGLILTLKDQLQNVLPKILNTSANFELIVFGVLMVLVLQYARHGVWPILGLLVDGADRRRDVRGRAAPQQAQAAGAARAAREGDAGAGSGRIRKEFGGLVAVNDISFSLKAGEIMGLIGPNGAGKSTTFNLISGVLPMTRGKVSFLGQRVDAMAARTIASLGVGRTSSTCNCCPP